MKQKPKSCTGLSGLTMCSRLDPASLIMRDATLPPLQALRATPGIRAALAGSGREGRRALSERAGRQASINIPPFVFFFLSPPLSPAARLPLAASPCGRAKAALLCTAALKIQRAPTLDFKSREQQPSRAPYCTELSSEGGGLGLAYH